MFLKRVEISGFKSFANKTLLDFEPGVTAVVGPNGSGKSNVADAIRWVLGEQSMKNLRGKKSEDVIFIGSDKKNQASCALVSLVLRDTDKDGDVIISRKVSRSGESDYQINKSSVRLTDVVDLLARSGISQKGYCVISQGLADEILRATPAERRDLFGEAAGVKQYQLQKERSIRKLQSSQRNLAQVKLLLDEIAPRLRTLKVQANRAKQKEEVEALYQKLRVEYFKKSWQRVFTKMEMAEANYKIFADNIQKFANEVEMKRRELEKIQKEIGSGGDDEQKLRANLDLLQVKRNNLERDLAITDGRIQMEAERAKEKIFVIPVDSSYVSKKLNHLLEKLSSAQKVVDVSDIQKVIALACDEVNVLLADMKEGKITRKEKINVNDNTAVLLGLKEKKTKIEKEILLIKKETAAAREKIKNISDSDRDCREKVFTMEKDLRQREFELSNLKDRFRNVDVERESVKMQMEEVARSMRAQGVNYKDIEVEIKKGCDVEFTNKSENQIFDELQKTKFKMEQIGAIDPLVIKEYEETNERFEFLSGQSEDLNAATKSLRKVIKDLSEQIEVKFNAAFNNISAQFNKYFRTLFGGGLAGLQKIELKKNRDCHPELVSGSLGNISKNEILKRVQDDRGDAERIEDEECEEDDFEDEINNFGVDIKVMLPGKKIKELEMLSGGERALTSIAILFAIVSNDPPPFAVLDEVDASLDESNSYKLASIVKDFKSTQFVIITHNRELMRQSHAIYGVTMQNDGVSKLLSMKL